MAGVGSGRGGDGRRRAGRPVGAQRPGAGEPAGIVARRRAPALGPERGGAVVELALLIPLLAVVVFGVVDLSRAWQLQSRLSNAAREGAEVARVLPANVDSGCHAPRNVFDRARAEDPSLAFHVTVARVTGAGTTTYTGCGTEHVPAGERVVVTASADLDLLTPYASAFVGSDTVTISRSVDVVVQG